MLFHPNIYPCGKVCLSILDEDDGWSAAVTIPQILHALQTLLDEPNNNSPAQEAPYKLLKNNKAGYRKKILEQARKFAPVL